MIGRKTVFYLPAEIPHLQAGNVLHWQARDADGLQVQRVHVAVPVVVHRAVHVVEQRAVRGRQGVYWVTSQPASDMTMLR